MQYLRALCPKLPRPPKPPVFDNASCGLSPLASRYTCQLLSMFLANVAISRTADINRKTSVCLLISETDVWIIGFDLLGSGDGGIPHHSNIIRLHKPIRMMPVPSVLH